MSSHAAELNDSTFGSSFSNNLGSIQDLHDVSSTRSNNPTTSQDFVDAVRAGAMAYVDELLRDDQHDVNGYSSLQTWSKALNAYYDEFPLYVAAVAGHTNIVALLLAHNANVSQCVQSSVFRETALMSAVRCNHIDIVDMLLTAGARVNDNIMISNKGSADILKEYNCRSALMEACKSRYGDIVQLLLERGALVDARDYKHETALMHAARSGNGEIVSLLLEKGAAVNASTDEDVLRNTPLCVAASEGHTNVVQILLDAGAETNNVKATPMWFACKNDHVNVVEMLLNRTENLQLPLGVACECGNTDVVEKLIGGGANVNEAVTYKDDVSKRELTPLCIAVFHQNADVVHCLLSNGARVDATSLTTRKQTNEVAYVCALDLAASRGSTECVRLLLLHAIKHGSDGGV